MEHARDSQSTAAFSSPEKGDTDDLLAVLRWRCCTLVHAGALVPGARVQQLTASRVRAGSQKLTTSSARAEEERGRRQEEELAWVATMRAGAG